MSSLRNHDLVLPPRFPADAVLAFYARRAIPGVEHVRGTSYRRSFAFDGEAGWFEADLTTGRVAIRHARPAADALVLERLRSLFDLDAPQAKIRRCFARDARLGPLIREHRDIRVPGCWDGFELGVRAVLGQQITVAAARTIASRIVARHAQRIEGAADDEPCHSLFPDARVFVGADFDGLGLTGARIATLRALAQAVVAGEVDFDPAQGTARFVARCTAVRGIGDWTAHYMAMRALRDPDAFPAGDIVLRKVLQPGTTLSAKELERASQPWRPFRAYAVLLLWRAA
ncbi:MAG TPA: AlkA N-terminal domain-containing protein [Tahibacter sp.]|uniref:DNA-3-methyladenine glycosylase family protein n=1 Tax=Tahibacter sp. TaxID=2056211 RepID=UPI002CD354E0|nr:AlkA N-terminal domain-containing protein [Tahibacter sp.]HSX60489.1 AlkA N-terminal domain-containing protein [Tahibacter sp.]